MTVEEAKAEARSTGSSVRGAYQGITAAPGAAGQIPGYQDTYPGLTQYYDNPGNMYADGAAADLHGADLHPFAAFREDYTDVQIPGSVACVSSGVPTFCGP